MRLRTALLSFVALVASLLGNQAPASAAFGGVLTGTMSISCYGCGYVTDGNNATFNCAGVCGSLDVICVTCPGWANDFTLDMAPGDPNCVISATMFGNLTFRGRTEMFHATLVGNVWVMSSGFGFGAGVLAVTSPLGASPCGKPVTAQLAGTIVGA